MSTTRPLTSRLTLWQIFLGMVVAIGVIVMVAALVERRYALALMAFAALAIGLPIAAHLRKLRRDLRAPEDEG